MHKWSIVIAVVLVAAQGEAQVSLWKLGGARAWSASDSSEVFIDFATFPGSMAPVYFTGEDNILSKLDLWSPFKFPTDLSYEDGLIPRVWRAANGFYWFTAGTLTTEWVDGDSSSYSPPVARGINSEWYTFDVGVPVPADVVGFYTPPHGFRADGSLLRDDIFKAFEASSAEEFDPVRILENNDNDYHRLETLVSDVPLNFAANVQLGFPKQYVRFIRLRRKPSIDDKTFASGQANVQQGTIGEFELKGAGVPKRVFYVSKIIDLGCTVNFGAIRPRSRRECLLRVYRHRRRAHRQSPALRKRTQAARPDHRRPDPGGQTGPARLDRLRPGQLDLLVLPRRRVRPACSAGARQPHPCAGSPCRASRTSTSYGSTRCGSRPRRLWPCRSSARWLASMSRRPTAA